MKKTFLFLMMSVLGCGLAAAQNTLTVTLADGAKVYQLSERPELLWEGDNIVISTTTTEVTVPRSSFKGFSLSEASAIEALKNGGSRISIGADGLLQADGLKAACQVKVYDASGRLLHQQTVKADGHLAISLASQPSGAYFVKMDNQPTLKIMKP